jgi:rhodanese-related sulfurtransferase
MTHSKPRNPARRRLVFLLLGLPLAAGALSAMLSRTGVDAADAVSVQEARDAHEAGTALLIDIREADEHARGVAAGAKLLPMSQLRQRVSEIPTDPARPVLLICHTQNRSSATLKALRQQGYAHVRYVHGGMSAWMRHGWPVVSPGG